MRDRVNRMGGVGAWREREREGRERWGGGGGWDDGGEKREGGGEEGEEEGVEERREREGGEESDRREERVRREGKERDDDVSAFWRGCAGVFGFGLDKCGLLMGGECRVLRWI